MAGPDLVLDNVLLHLADLDEVTERVAGVDNRVLEHPDKQGGERCLHGGFVGFERVGDPADSLSLVDDCSKVAARTSVLSSRLDSSV